jgi:methionyl-tRNA formyltransferase
MPASKDTLLVGHDKIGRKLIHAIEERGLRVRTYLDKSTTSRRVIRLLLRRRLKTLDLFKMYRAETLRKDWKIRDYPPVTTYAKLCSLLTHQRPDRVFLFRSGMILRKNLLDTRIEFYNVHCARLPGYEGLGALLHALGKRDLDQHATLYRIDGRIDQGEIIDTEPYRLSPCLSYQENEDVACEAGIRLLLRVLEQERYKGAV